MATCSRAALAAVICLAAGAAAADAVIEMPADIRDTAIGPVLVDDRGMTLYTFDEDPPGRSTCYGECAELWPPFEATGDIEPEGGFGIIEREDGVLQYTFRDKPLYHWTLEEELPGEAPGDRYEDRWTAARP